MSATEIIEQIKTLPPREQKTVVDFVERLRGQTTSDAAKHPAEIETIESVAERIFDRYDPLFRKLAE